MQWTIFVDFDICHQMASLRKLYSVTLTYFLKVTTCNVNILQKVRACADKYTTPFIDFDICRKYIIPEVVRHDIDQLFQGHTF